jgi:hypothetical protein
MFYIIIYALIFNIIYNILRTSYEPKMAQNFTSGIHLFICLAINLLFLYFNQLWIYSLGVLITTGHYLFDIYYLLTFKEMNIMTAVLIYHHLATITYIQYDPYLYLGHYVLILAEISNIPALFIYHYLKSDPKSDKLKWWLMIQKIIYISIRIPLLLIFSYLVWINTHDIMALIIAGPVYLMGIIWSLKLLTK